jgi:hypothetical protein
LPTSPEPCYSRLPMLPLPTDMRCENVVCDVHLADMSPVRVTHGMGLYTKLLEGFAKCPVDGCTRFFGTEGYCDLTKDGDFTNIRTEPCCSSQHEPQPMSIQRTADRLHWSCPLCRARAPFSR